jgi:hypothetical protein
MIDIKILLNLRITGTDIKLGGTPHDVVCSCGRVIVLILLAESSTSLKSSLRVNVCFTQILRETEVTKPFYSWLFSLTIRINISYGALAEQN